MTDIPLLEIREDGEAVHIIRRESNGDIKSWEIVTGPEARELKKELKNASKLLINLMLRWINEYPRD